MTARGTNGPEGRAITAREQDVATTLVRLADTLDVDFNLLTSLAGLAADCVRLLGVSGVGLTLGTPRNELTFVAASSDESRNAEMAQLESGNGPSLECFHTGENVSSADLSVAADRWPRFTAAAIASGFRSVHALPMRLRADVIGAVDLYADVTGDLDPEALALARALTEMATITIMRDRVMREKEQLAAQLQTALTTRVLIEQAKGVLAERGGLSVDDAFRVLRKYARDHNLTLVDLSRSVVDNTADLSIVLGEHRASPVQQKPFRSAE